jgi:phage tail-like protein
MTSELLSTSRFYLEITLNGVDQEIDGYFMECSGFERSQDVIEISEVTPQVWGASGNTKGRVVGTTIPGNTKCSNIVLKQGLSLSTTFWNWFTLVEAGNWDNQLRDGDITVYDQSATEQARFRFTGAWPVRYKLPNSFKADSSEFAVVELELSVSEFYRVVPS